MKKKFSGSSDLAILEESSGRDEDAKNADKENMILEETSSEATQEKMKKGRRAIKVESSEESAEEQDDVMSLEEEEEMALRFRRNSCIHGARRKSLDGLCTNHIFQACQLKMCRSASWTVVQEIIPCRQGVSQQRR